MEFVILSASVSALIKLATNELYSVHRANKKRAVELQTLHNKFRKLYNTYSQIAKTLEKFDCWQRQNAITDIEAAWLHDLVMHCYETEDLIDDLILSLPTGEANSERPRKHSVRPHTIKPKQLDELQKNLTDLGGQIENLLEIKGSNSAHSLRCYTRVLLDKTPLVLETSRVHDKQTIIQELTSLKPRLSGVSILGMDGLGKTSLAQIIMDDEKIINHFELILSASASGFFQTEDIVHKLLANSLKASTEPDESPRSRNLEDIIRKKRALIILDDLWSVPDKEWESFRCNYLQLSSSWKILITTRSPNVARVTQSSAHYLDRMTDEDCTKLIMEKAKQSSYKLEISASDANDIAKKCSGMPILADKFGLTLSQGSSVGELIEIMRHLKNTILWKLPEFKEVFPSFKLNEPKMPSHIERCIAYCSLFSPNHKFIREDLIKLWEVEGLIRGSQQTGRECFEDLLSRSILRPSDPSNQKLLSYKMPEFIFKFAQLLASKAFLQIDKDATNFPPLCKYIRHLSLTCEDINEPLLKQIESCEELRTFLLPHTRPPKIHTISSNFFLKFKRLRLLDLSCTSVKNLLAPSKPFKSLFKKSNPFKHLRYLDLSWSCIEELPEPVNPLQTLQVLKVEHCSKLNELPKDLNELVSLTHLYVDLKRLRCLPPKLGNLEDLEVLFSFSVENMEGYKVAELKNMMQLREIHISHLEKVNDKEEAEESMLSLKSMLRRLVLEWESSSAQMANVREVLEGLEPHNDLTDLTVRNYKCQRFPAWISSPSKKLVSIYLQNCRDCQVLPSLGDLPLLNTLVLDSFENLEIVDRRFYGQGDRAFQSLESLEFRDMRTLIFWIGLDAGDMPCLHSLKIIDCPKLLRLPSLEHHGSLVKMEIASCMKLKSLELPSSINRKRPHLIITGCPSVGKRCYAAGADGCHRQDFSHP